jgi:hypothetical protein
MRSWRPEPEVLDGRAGVRDALEDVVAGGRGAPDGSVGGPDHRLMVRGGRDRGGRLGERCSGGQDDDGGEPAEQRTEPGLLRGSTIDRSTVVVVVPTSYPRLRSGA